MNKLIDFESYAVKPVLPVLLKDQTTGQNIIWATDTYADKGCQDTHQIDIAQLIGLDRVSIMPRAEKAKAEQVLRTRKKAEVFTPTWMCNYMNNNADNSWFGYAGAFNAENDHQWTVNPEKVAFPEGKSWKDYVLSRRLEITCGEAPFLVSRYDAATGEPIVPPGRRVGILDRKLRIVNENCDVHRTWITWALKAFQSCYGYEYQGDNLLIARINLMESFRDYHLDRWQKEPDISTLKKAAEIISWNVWQMDGFTDTVPLGKPQQEYRQLSLFDMGEEDKTAPFCKIKRWDTGEEIIFHTLK